jgi:murein DD-endopeptidase MepM/ murein hydrolase activator NlpD
LYYAHLKAPSGLEPGEGVEAGQKVGEVGSTGQGREGTRGRFEPHLHLGWYEGGWFGEDRSGKASGAMNPYPLLRRLGEYAVAPGFVGGANYPQGAKREHEWRLAAIATPEG